MAVAQGILPIADDILCVCRQHHLHHLHGIVIAGLIFRQIPIQRHLEIGCGHNPLLPVLIEERLEYGVNALLPEHLDAGRRAEVHGNLSVLELLDDRVKVVVQILRGEVGVLNELLHALKDSRPNGIVQPHRLIIARVAVSGAPLLPRRRRKLPRRQALQGFHAGVVVHVIRRKPANPHFLKCIASGDKAVIIRGQWDIILLEQSPVDNETMGVCADRQPVYAAVFVHKTVQIGVVNRTRLIRCGQVQQAVFQRTCIVERKSAAGDNIRQAAVFIEEFVEVQIVVAHHKFNIHVRQL